MITGEIKNQIDRIWDSFWSGGISNPSNPLEVIEQITYLLFLRRLDDLHILEMNKAAQLSKPMARRIFPEGKDGIGEDGGRPYDAGSTNRRSPISHPKDRTACSLRRSSMS